MRASDFVLSRFPTHTDPAGWGFSKQMSSDLRENLTVGLLALHEAGLTWDKIKLREAGRHGRGIESPIGKLDLH